MHTLRYANECELNNPTSMRMRMQIDKEQHKSKRRKSIITKQGSKDSVDGISCKDSKKSNNISCSKECKDMTSYAFALSNSMFDALNVVHVLKQLFDVSRRSQFVFERLLKSRHSIVYTCKIGYVDLSMMAAKMLSVDMQLDDNYNSTTRDGELLERVGYGLYLYTTLYGVDEEKHVALLSSKEFVDNVNYCFKAAFGLHVDVYPIYGSLAVSDMLKQIHKDVVYKGGDNTAHSDAENDPGTMLLGGFANVLMPERIYMYKESDVIGYSRFDAYVLYDTAIDVLRCRKKKKLLSKDNGVHNVIAAFEYNVVILDNNSAFADHLSNMCALNYNKDKDTYDDVRESIELFINIEKYFMHLMPCTGATLNMGLADKNGDITEVHARVAVDTGSTGIDANNIHANSLSMVVYFGYCIRKVFAEVLDALVLGVSIHCDSVNKSDDYTDIGAHDEYTVLSYARCGPLLRYAEYFTYSTYCNALKKIELEYDKICDYYDVPVKYKKVAKLCTYELHLPEQDLESVCRILYNLSTEHSHAHNLLFETAVRAACDKCYSCKMCRNKVYLLTYGDGVNVRDMSNIILNTFGVRVDENSIDCDIDDFAMCSIEHVEDVKRYVLEGRCNNICYAPEYDICRNISKYYDECRRCAQDMQSKAHNIKCNIYEQQVMCITFNIEVCGDMRDMFEELRGFMSNFINITNTEHVEQLRAFDKQCLACIPYTNNVCNLGLLRYDTNKNISHIAVRVTKMNMPVTSSTAANDKVCMCILMDVVRVFEKTFRVPVQRASDPELLNLSCSGRDAFNNIKICGPVVQYELINDIDKYRNTMHDAINKLVYYYCEDNYYGEMLSMDYEDYYTIKATSENTNTSDDE